MTQAPPPRAVQDAPAHFGRRPMLLRIAALLLSCLPLQLAAAEPARPHTAGPGVRVFTPGRIRDAAHLARTVAAKRGL